MKISYIGWLFVFALACGGGQIEETVSAPLEAASGHEEALDDAPGTIIEAVQLLDDDDRGITIDAEGNLVVDGHPIGRWLADGTFEDDTGTAEVRIDSDGRLVTADGEELARFEGDVIEAADGTRFEIGADGLLPVTERTSLRLVPADSRARRIALGSFLLVRWANTVAGAQ